MEHSALQPSAHLALVELAAGAAGSSSSSFADRPSKVKLDGNKQLFLFNVHVFTYFTFLRHVGKKVMCFALWWFFVSIFGTAARDVNRNRPSRLSCKLHQTVFPNPPTQKKLNFSISSSQREFQMF
jgi:hypothetical protein